MIMPGEQRDYTILRDDDDNYFAVPREVLDHHRVRREWKAKIRQYLDGEDVEGFVQIPGKTPLTAADAAGLRGLHIVGIITLTENPTAGEAS
jgi:hypothetical protein